MQTSNPLHAARCCCSVNQEAQEDGETILLVEDEAFVREVTCEVLRAAGYMVLSAENAVSAMQAYREHPGGIQLLLTDIVLPGEDGRTLARQLRLENPGLCVLFVSGYPDQMARCAQERSEFLAKPFSSEDLLATVRKLLDGRQTWLEPPVPLRHAAGSV